MVNCIEASSCPPVNPTDVLNLFDVWFGTGFTLAMMGLIIGAITVAIYLHNRSLPMLAILGIYEFAAFGSIITSKYFTSQYNTMEYVVIFGIATGVIMMVLRLVKE